MAPDTDSEQKAVPQVIVHVFETNEGTARPIKTLRSDQGGLRVAFAARRSHRKSREGCLRCKLRRIKCDEQKPICENCSRKGSECIYGGPLPVLKTKPVQCQNVPMAFPSLTSDTFTMQDMRFFHHFLLKAKPHMPVGNDAVWSRDIPQFAQHNPFLMHAMLALGSTHLGRLLDSDCYQVQSLTYRVKGLDGLRKAVAKPRWNHGDADSFIAAGYALMQQSAHIEDALPDWISLFRLIWSISARVIESQEIVTEFNLRPETHGNYIDPYLHLMPAIDARILHHAVEELENLLPHLRTAMAIDFHQRLIHCLREHQVSPPQGYTAFGGIFPFWIYMTDSQFATFVDPQQDENQLLMLHFVALLIIMAPLSIIENHHLLDWSSPRHILGILGWAQTASANISPRLRMYTRFPDTVISITRAEVSGVGVEGPSVMQYDATMMVAQEMKRLRLSEKASK